MKTESRVSAVVILVLLACGVGVSEEAAQRIAQDRFASFCESFRIDPTLLRGPTRIRPEDPGFTFEWMVPDSEPTVRIEVWVSEGGRPEVSSGPGFERLEGSANRSRGP